MKHYYSVPILITLIQFAVFQDNKYAYDRIFTFYPNNAHPQNKATQIPLNTLYKNNQ